MEHKENTEKQAVFVDALVAALDTDGGSAAPIPPPPGAPAARHQITFGPHCQVFYIGSLHGPTTFSIGPGGPPHVAPQPPAPPAWPRSTVVACVAAAISLATLWFRFN